MDKIIYPSDYDTKAYTLYSSACPFFFFFSLNNSRVLNRMLCSRNMGNCPCVGKRRWLSGLGQCSKDG